MFACVFKYPAQTIVYVPSPFLPTPLHVLAVPHHDPVCLASLMTETPTKHTEVLGSSSEVTQIDIHSPLRMSSGLSFVDAVSMVDLPHQNQPQLPVLGGPVFGVHTMGLSLNAISQNNTVVNRMGLSLNAISQSNTVVNRMGLSLNAISQSNTVVNRIHRNS